MSDSKFINTYIDVIIGTLHEHLNTILQLKTQQKITNDLIREKDEVISSLETKLQSLSESEETSRFDRDTLLAEAESLRTNAKIWEESYTAMKNKISHMDTLTNQLNQFKQDIIAKTNEIETVKAQFIKELEKKNNEIFNLKSEIATLKGKPAPKETKKETVKASVKEEINNKSKPVTQEVVIQKPKTLDDF